MSDDPVAYLRLRVATGDRAAFHDIRAATSAKPFGASLRILGARARAEDALQEVFTRVWLHARRSGQSRGAGMTWLIAIAHNHAIDLIRARPPATTTDDTDLEIVADDRPDVLERIVAAGVARRIADCFATLEPAPAAAVQSAQLRGLSDQAPADRHGVPLHSIRTWLRRSLPKLRECMEL